MFYKASDPVYVKIGSSYRLYTICDESMLVKQSSHKQRYEHLYLKDYITGEIAMQPDCPLEKCDFNFVLRNRDAFFSNCRRRGYSIIKDFKNYCEDISFCNCMCCLYTVGENCLCCLKCGRFCHESCSWGVMNKTFPKLYWYCQNCIDEYTCKLRRLLAKIEYSVGDERQNVWNKIREILDECDIIDDFGMIKCIGDLSNNVYPYEAKFEITATNVEIYRKLKSAYNGYISADSPVCLFESHEGCLFLNCFRTRITTLFNPVFQFEPLNQSLCDIELPPYCKVEAVLAEKNNYKLCILSPFSALHAVWISNMSYDKFKTDKVQFLNQDGNMYDEEANQLSSCLCQISALHKSCKGCEVCSMIEPYDDLYSCDLCGNVFHYGCCRYARPKYKECIVCKFNYHFTCRNKVIIYYLVEWYNDIMPNSWESEDVVKSLFSGIHFLNIFHGNYKYPAMDLVVRDILTNNLTFKTSEECRDCNNLMKNYNEEFDAVLGITIVKENRCEMECLILPFIQKIIKDDIIIIMCRNENWKLWFHAVYSHVTSKVCILREKSANYIKENFNDYDVCITDVPNYQEYMGAHRNAIFLTEVCSTVPHDDSNNSNSIKKQITVHITKGIYDFNALSVYDEYHNNEINVLSPSSLFYNNTVIRCEPSKNQKKCIENLMFRKYNALHTREDDPTNNEIDFSIKLACQTSDYSSSPYGVYTSINHEEPSKIKDLICLIKELFEEVYDRKILIYTRYQCFIKYIVSALTTNAIPHQRLLFNSSELLTTNPRINPDINVYVCHYDELTYDINMSFIDTLICCDLAPNREDVDYLFRTRYHLKKEMDIETFTLSLSNCEDLIYGFYAMEDGTPTHTIEQLTVAVIEFVDGHFLRNEQYTDNTYLLRNYKNNFHGYFTTDPIHFEMETVMQRVNVYNQYKFLYPHLYEEEREELIFKGMKEDLSYMDSDKCNELLILYDRLPKSVRIQKMYEELKEEYKSYIIVESDDFHMFHITMNSFELNNYRFDIRHINDDYLKLIVTGIVDPAKVDNTKLLTGDVVLVINGNNIGTQSKDVIRHTMNELSFDGVELNMVIYRHQI